MKICIICLVMLLAAGTAYSQPSATSATPTKQDFLKKSKSQKTAAWIFLAGGGTLVVLGAMDADNTGYSDETRSTALVVTGIAAIGVSTTLFIASTRNKKKGEAMSLNFKMDHAPTIQQGSLVKTHYPALSLRLRL